MRTESTVGDRYIVMVGKSNQCHSYGCAACILITLLGLCLSVYAKMQNLGIYSEENREICLKILNEIQLEMTPEEIRNTLLRHELDDNWAFIMESQDLGYLHTPTEFGGSNWKIIFGFKGSELTNVRVRTEDSEFIHPDEAPEDLFNE